MAMQVSQTPVFHSEQCPTCKSFEPEAQACLVDSEESGPIPLLRVDNGDPVEPCVYFEPGAMPAAVSLAAAAPIDGEPPVSLVETALPGEPESGEVSEPVLVMQNVAIEAPAAPDSPAAFLPARGEPRIHCQKCKAENPATAQRCQNCDANLLPAEGIKSRILTFVTLILAAAVIGTLFFLFYVQNPGSAPDVVFFHPVVLGIGAFLALISAITLPFRRTPTYLKYVNRASRHSGLNVWQALEDINQAMDLAPEKEQGKLLRQRADIFEKIGWADDAARDRLVLATSPDTYKGEGNFVAAFTGADQDTYSRSRLNSQIKTILHSGKARAVGYCPQCKTAVELDQDQRCPLHPKTKGHDVVYVIPNDVLSGKLSVMQKMEARHPHISEQITQLMQAGQAEAVGYCPRCKAAVVLDLQRRCTIHPKSRVKMVQYVVPGDIPKGKRNILVWRRAEKASGGRLPLYIISLIFIVYAMLTILDVDVAAIVKNLIVGLR